MGVFKSQKKILVTTFNRYSTTVWGVNCFYKRICNRSVYLYFILKFLTDGERNIGNIGILS